MEREILFTLFNRITTSLLELILFITVNIDFILYKKSIAICILEIRSNQKLMFVVGHKIGNDDNTDGCDVNFINNIGVCVNYSTSNRSATFTKQYLRNWFFVVSG